MKWLMCTLTYPQTTGKDRLNNPITEDKEVLRTFCRRTPFTVEEMALDGRKITEDSSKFLLCCRKSRLPKFDKLVLDGSVYIVKKTEDLQKFTLVYAEAFKVED